MGRCTVTGMLCSSGRQFKDWSWAYRLFNGDLMDMSKIFSVIRKEAVEMLPTGENIYAHMDDTLLRKRGKRYQALNG